MRVSKKVLIAGAAGVLVVAGAGTALAYWTASGSGSGYATTGSSSPFTVTLAAAANSPALSPGGPTNTYTVTITNPSTGAQRVNAATASVAGNNGATWTAVAGCSAADYAVSAVTLTPATLAAGASTTATFTVQMVNATTNQDACKNATVPLFVAVS